MKLIEFPSTPSFCMSFLRNVSYRTHFGMLCNKKYSLSTKLHTYSFTVINLSNYINNKPKVLLFKFLYYRECCNKSFRVTSVTVELPKCFVISGIRIHLIS